MHTATDPTSEPHTSSHTSSDPPHANDGYFSSHRDSEEFDTWGVRNPDQKRPSPRQREHAKRELTKRFGLQPLRFIEKGGYGYVYKVPYKGTTLVVKILLNDHRRADRDRSRHVSLPKRIDRIRTCLLRALDKRNRNKRTARARQDRSERQFYTEDLAFPSRDGALMFHIMEYIPGWDMHRFFDKNGKVTAQKCALNPKRYKVRSIITFPKLMRIWCRLMHAVDFFHDAGIAFNDLKPENTIVHSKKYNVTLIDYIDSCTGCTHLKCAFDNPDLVRTFSDKFADTPSLAEDVWRLALTMLDSASLLFPDDIYDFPAERLKDLMKRYVHRSPATRNARYTDEVEHVVDECIDLMYDRFRAPSSCHHTRRNEDVSRLFHHRYGGKQQPKPRHFHTTHKATPTPTALPTVHMTHAHVVAFKRIFKQMLHVDPSKRPSVHALLRSPHSPFNVCVTNRNNTMKRMLRQRRLGKEAVEALRKEVGASGA